MRKLDRVLASNARIVELFHAGCELATVAQLEEQWEALEDEKSRYSCMEQELTVHRHGYGFQEAKAKWTVAGKHVAAVELEGVLVGVLEKLEPGSLVVPGAAPVGRGSVKEAKLLGTLTDHKIKILELQKAEVSGDRAPPPQLCGRSSSTSTSPGWMAPPRMYA